MLIELALFTILFAVMFTAGWSARRATNDPHDTALRDGKATVQQIAAKIAREDAQQRNTVRGGKW